MVKIDACFPSSVFGGSIGIDGFLWLIWTIEKKLEVKKKNHDEPKPLQYHQHLECLRLSFLREKKNSYLEHCRFFANFFMSGT